MTTDNYSLLKMWEEMGGDNGRKYGGSKKYKILRAWYHGYMGEVSTINSLVKIGAIKQVTKVQVKELVW